MYRFSILSLLLLTGPLGAAEKGHVRKPPPSAAEIAKLPKDGGEEFNRLVHTTSPYLLQHARNPVDWYPWGEEAFATAKKLDKPIFLSVGYSACHWCHVMEHESFEHEGTAKLMNELYVCVKVDREERPDVDQIYMTATHLITGRGGWPNSIWLTSDARPYYAGTYFPRERFEQMLTGLGNAWKNKRGDVEAQAERLGGAIKQAMENREVRKPGKLTEEPMNKAISQFKRTFDEKLGGFGKAPKFPPHAKLRFLLVRYDQTKDKTLLPLVTTTLDQMILGGIHDHIGGGFHRYSTDAKWFLPHFEKMLYDNGQLSWVLSEAYRITKEPRYKDALIRLNDWVLRDMTDKQGGFYSALDADSGGEEGTFYIWKYSELVEILGEQEGALFAKVYNCPKEGNYFEEANRKPSGASIAHLSGFLADTAKTEKIDPAALEKRLAVARQKLLTERVKRIWPGLDDKVLTSWNGLMIGGLAHAGQVFEEPRYVQAAEKAADFILTSMRKDGRLFRTYRNGQAHLNAYLDDYAFLADGLLDLHAATKNKKWLVASEELVKTMIAFYEDGNNGGFFFTAHDHEALLARNMEPFDNATPSGNSVAFRVLTRLAATTGKPDYYERAEKNLKTFVGQVDRVPSASSTLLEAILLFKKIPAPKTAGGGGTSDAHARIKPVSLDLYASALQAVPGSEIDVVVRLTIDEKWHVNSNKPLEDYLIPTSVKLVENSAFTLSDPVYPQAKVVKLGGFPDKVSIYEHTVDIKATVKISEKAKPGKTDLSFLVETQACDDQSCLRPEIHTLKVAVEVVAKVGDAEKRHPAVFK